MQGSGRDPDEINEQYLNEFLAALQTSINQMSADGIRISYVPSRSRELGRYMADTLDEEWSKLRGMEIQAVGIASISYDEESQNLINMRNKGAMMGNPMVREGYVQSTIAEGLKSAGENPAGSMAGFMGMGFGMQTGGGFMGTASAANAEQMPDDGAKRRFGRRNGILRSRRRFGSRRQLRSRNRGWKRGRSGQWNCSRKRGRRNLDMPAVQNAE